MELSMKKVMHINTISDYNALVGHPTLHPLVSLIDFSKSNPRYQRDASVNALSFSFYLVFFKDSKHCAIRYGRNFYDYQQGTLLFISPGQVISIEEDAEDYQPSGLALLFHPDLLRGTHLGQHLKDYTFFSYEVHE